MPGADDKRPFSKRHGHAGRDREITIWEDAPETVRYVVLDAAKSETGGGLKPSTLRDIVCHVLRTRPDPSNWSEYPNIWDEVQSMVNGCDWYRMYDIAEAIAQHLARWHEERYRAYYEDEVNDALREEGVGWQLKDGLVQSRGDDAHEKLLAQATEALEAAKLPTARSEMREALGDLSRRPEPDLSGAVQHAMAALECVAREVTGDRKPTLGDLLKKHPGLLPKPLDAAVEKVWGYASEQARHGREGRAISRAEAELVVGLSATVATYLAQKLGEKR